MSKKNPARDACLPCAISRSARGAAAMTVFTCSREKKSFLRELLEKVPALRAKVPEQFVVEGYWNGEHLGRKTATRPTNYRSADFPAHFTRTLCVFGDRPGLLRTRRSSRVPTRQHPWSYKPTTCWMFPLQDDEGEVAEPVRGPEDDPHVAPDYPGYASCLPCGQA